MSADRPVVVGIDIGGTGCRFVATSAGRVVGESTRSTAELGAGDVPTRIGRVVAEIGRLIPPSDRLAGVGIGATGPVDLATGEIDNPATLPAFSGVGLVSALAGRLGCPVVIDNDSVAAAYGEHGPGGAGAGSQRLLMITLGTGVGGALLIDGEPYRTSTNTHPEIGHLPVFGGDRECYCGLRGCWEPRASRAALERALGQYLDRSPGRQLPDRATIVTAARRHDADPGIRRIFHEYGECVGRGLACLQAVHGPEIIIIGGGAAACLPLFESGMRSALTQHQSYSAASPVVVAALGERAGAVGAAAMVQRVTAPTSVPVDD